LKLKANKLSPKTPEGDSIFADFPNLMHPSINSEMHHDESTEATRYKNEALSWKQKYEEIKTFLTKTEAVETTKKISQKDIHKIWESVELLSQSVKKLFDSFKKLTQNSSNRSISSLLNFDVKKEHSDYDEEVEAFLIEDEEDELEVSVPRIMLVVKQIQANINKLLRSSSEVYIDQCTNECNIQ
jgi:hypothetical protein